MDIIAALHWTKDNIAAFGGDPSRVTVVGHDTGAALANLVLISKNGKGTFNLRPIPYSLRFFVVPISFFIQIYCTLCCGRYALYTIFGAGFFVCVAVSQINGHSLTFYLYFFVLTFLNSGTKAL